MVERFVDPILHLILLVSAVVFIFWGFALLFTPLSAMKGFLWVTLGGEDFSRLWGASSLLFFMLRSSGAICIWLGSIFWLASKDPSRYLELIRVSGFMLLFYFAASSVAGLLYGLPAAVFALDSGLALLGGAVLLRFTRRLPLFEDLDAEV